jgi:glutamate racemase
MNQPIGVFDSGIGGLSILRDLRARLPLESFVYFADSAHNPYGEKGDAFVIERSRAITRELVEAHHIKALVVACNTATAAAIHVLRAEFPQLPIVGVEPALKPAAAASRTKRIAVLATRGTLHSAKFKALLDSLKDQAEFICVPGEGLAEQIEQQLLVSNPTSNATDLIAGSAHSIWAQGHFSSQNPPIDTLVLGCTHYPLIRPVFEQLAGPTVQIIDNGPAVARRLADVLGAHASSPSPASAAMHNRAHDVLLSSGDVASLRAADARVMMMG